jgi:hypothetical protein
VEKKYMAIPDVTPEDLEDKSKQDTIAKTVTCFQIMYLVFDCLGRAAQGLAITILELSALAIVACSVLTSLCWMHKPLDVRRPIRLRIKYSIEEILEKAGESGKTVSANPARFYRRSPPQLVAECSAVHEHACRTTHTAYPKSRKRSIPESERVPGNIPLHSDGRLCRDSPCRLELLFSDNAREHIVEGVKHVFVWKHGCVLGI